MWGRAKEICSSPFEESSEESAPPMTMPDPLDFVDTAQLVAHTRELIAIPSVNPFAPGETPPEGEREQEIAQRYGEMLGEVGCEVRLETVSPGRPNVVGSLKGSKPGPTVLLAGHLDTVGVTGYDDPFEARVTDGRIYGRGSCDMKAALAAFVEVGRLLHRGGCDFAGELLIAGIADEEDRMAGSAHWAQVGPVPDYAIVGEPSSLVVCPAHKGQLGMHIRTFGKAVHSSLRSQGVNAIEKMAEVIAAFSTYNDELTARTPHELVGHGTFSIGVINGGEIMSTVPDRCEIEVDRRMIPGETVDQVEAEYRAIIEPLAEADPSFRYELDGPTMHAAPLDTKLDSAVVTAIGLQFESVTGRPAIIEAFTGSTDAPNFGCPSVIFGPGSLAQAHSLDEFVSIDELVTATQVYLKTVQQLLASG